MNNRFKFIGSIFQFVIGILAILSFAVVLFSGGAGNILELIGAVLLSIGFIVSGVMGIMDYASDDGADDDDDE